MILDVGCGDNFRGDVNCNLLPYFNTHRGGHLPSLRVHHILNFVNCSGEYLPFKSNSFSIVYSSHVIEHVQKPKLLLSELVRVSRRRVLLTCPHRFDPLGAKLTDHLNYFRLSWFDQVLRQIQETVPLFFECELKWRPFLHVDCLVKICKLVT